MPCRTSNRTPDAMSQGARQRTGLLLGLTAVALLCFFALAVGAASASSHHGIEQETGIGQATTNPGTPYEAFDAVSLAAADLNGDDVKEIVAHNDNNHAYIFDGDTGELIAELSTRHPDGWAARELAGPAIGDVTGNGVTDIVLTNSAAWVTAFEARPTNDHRTLEVTKLWETRMDPEQQDPDRDWKAPGTDAPSFLADTDNDGRDETFSQLDDQPSIFHFGPDGGVEHWNDHSDGNGGPLVADVTGDGDDEVVYPSDGGQITIYEAETLAWRCQFNARHHDVWPGSISVSPTLADVTSDGRLEVIFGVRNVQEEQYDGWEDDSHAHYFALDADCSIVWQKTWDWSNPHVHMHPVPVDVTGNGELDAVFQDWNTVGHKPGNWQHTGPSNLFAVEGDTGELIWRNELKNYWSNKNVAVADVTGDGEPEILANEIDGGDGIGLYSLDGDKQGFVHAPDGWVVSKGPTVADLDTDHEHEIILPVHRTSDHCEKDRDVGCREGGLQIYEAASSGQLVYDNNHLLNADEEQARPPEDAPDDGDDDTTDGDGFDPSFENVRGNEWWIETDVESSDVIASAHARVDGGNWNDLEKKDWGAWAESIHAPQGSIVQLQARNADGDRALSGCYEWSEEPAPTTCPDGTDGGDDTGDSDTDDGTDGFEADFHNVRGNEWWIELEVDSDRDVTAVDTRLDSGDWIAMERQDWGSWAISEHAPEGTIVDFRAHSGSEAQATSGCWSWSDEPSSTSCPNRDTDDDGGDGDDSDASGDFEADFIEPRGNEWWIEVDVDSSDAIASVSARVDGGDWFSLERTDWGSWAQNTHVGEDVTVEFRATNDDGATDTSGEIAWPPPE